MNRDELRAAQTPLKEQYRLDPDAGLITLKAEGRIGEGVTCSVQTGRALVEAGLHPATGGTGMFACSGDMLLQALAACAGVTMAAVATSIGVNLRGGIVRAEGDLDFRGTLGVAKDVPIGFQRIRLDFEGDVEISVSPGGEIWGTGKYQQLDPGWGKAEVPGRPTPNSSDARSGDLCHRRRLGNGKFRSEAVARGQNSRTYSRSQPGLHRPLGRCLLCRRNG